MVFMPLLYIRLFRDDSLNDLGTLAEDGRLFNLTLAKGDWCSPGNIIGHDASPYVQASVVSTLIIFLAMIAVNAGATLFEML